MSSEKPGNVGPNQRFADASVDDFLRSADVVAPILGCSAESGVGQAVLDAALATKEHVGHNTNLGIILLLAPLASVPAGQLLGDGIEGVLERLTVHDAELVYRAIQVASPAGLGNVGDQDVNAGPTADLRTCMRLAADRDRIARQYANGFADVLETGVSLLQQTESWGESGEQRLGWLAVQLLARFGDSLILRKCGPATVEQVQQSATALLEAGFPQSPRSQQLYSQLDGFLRDAEHKRNPGTTADLVAAVVFAGLRERYWHVDDRGMVEF